MNFVIDQGNTFAKLAVFEQDKLVASQVFNELNNEIINLFISDYTIENAIISSVKKRMDKNLLKKYNLTHLTHLTPLPLQLKYKTPETLGVDRVAAVVGAISKYKCTNLLVIDIGTCITYDFVNSKKEYLGGAIAPGFEMRFKALNHFTEKLPLIKFDKKQVKLIGNTTESAIVSGVYNGMKNEIEGTINSYLLQYEALKIVVTGGDINLFDLEPKNRIFASEFLVLKGLNEILNYNAKK
ncbi:MAG: type III pantothenate kinase [Flavobacteriales bacterium]|nr:type III pantothenate kinase [Flavobacteriales bacterium]